MMTIFPFLIKVQICWLLFYMLYLGLFRKTTLHNYNRGYLLAAIILGLTLPLLQFIPVENLSIVAHFLLPEIKIPANQTINTSTATNFSYINLLTGMYVLGMIIAGIRLAIQFRYIWKLIIEGKIEKKEGYTKVSIPDIKLPFSFFNYLFWSDQLFYSPQEEKQILEHELAHMKGKHSFDVVSIELLSIAFWWSPFIYWYSRSLRLQHEYIADTAATHQKPLQQYGQLLIRQSISGNGFVLANHFFQSQLKQRIQMMTQPKSKAIAAFRYMACLPLMLLLATYFLNPTSATAQKKSDPVYSEVDVVPEFPGGQEAMFKEIFAKLKYPESAHKAKKEGTVFIGFIVEKDGKISNVTVKKGFDKDCENEAIKVVKNMPKWKPGEKGGKKVRTEMVLPFKFKLE